MRHFLVFAACLAACGGESAGSSLRVATVDTLPGGIVQVANTGPTVWSDTSGWRIVEERRIQPADGTPGEMGSPETLVAGADGTVYLLQSKPVTIKVYGPDGAWVRDIGRDGDGPGEFRGGMFTVAGDVLVIQDPNNTRMTTFRTTGEFLKAIPSQCCWWTSNFPVFDDGTVGILGPPPPAQKDRPGALYVTKMDGTVTDTILLPPRSRDEIQKGTWTITRSNATSSMVMGAAIPLQPSDVEAFLPARRRVLGTTDHYTLAITGLHRDTLRLFSAPAPTLTITEAQRDSIFESEIMGVSEDWREAMREVAKKSDIPTTWPAWSNLMVDGASRIWVGRPGPRGRTSVLDVFTPDGVLLGSVPAPHERIMEGFWTADHVYLRDETEDGLPQIIVYRIEQTLRKP